MTQTADASGQPVTLKPGTNPQAPNAKPPASPARPRKRHRTIFQSFVIMVLLPTAVAVLYLYLLAADQYASRVAFSVRSEEMPTTSELLGGLSALSSGASKDADVLYEFIASQNIVETVDSELDLASIYSKPSFDPVFAYDENGTIEDKLEYWRRMVKIDYDSGTGLIAIRANAFTAEDAQNVARAIFSASSATINRLSAIARDDITRYSREELDNAVDLLKSARRSMATFRNEEQIVDPGADIASQMGLLTSLQAQLSEAMIELDLLRDTFRTENDPRISEVERKIAVIQNRIEDERKKFGISTNSSKLGVFSELLSEYEELAIDLEFAQESYLLARTAYTNALAQSRRQSRYLAAYIEPTLAQSAEYPKRFLLSALIGLFLFLGWAISILAYYSLKDRR